MVLRVAVDTVPLLGPRTGIGMFTAALVEGLLERDDVEFRPWLASLWGRRWAKGIPGDVSRLPMPARTLRRVWLRSNRPALETWTGPVDVAHGTNYVVPPTRRAARLVSVHDLTPIRFPAMSTADTLQYPALLRRALATGAHAHTD
jgi:pimeloyl-ACP methyl ester carboxylesterase